MLAACHDDRMTPAHGEGSQHPPCPHHHIATNTDKVGKAA